MSNKSKFWLIILYQKLNNRPFNILIKLLTIPKIIPGRPQHLPIEILLTLPPHNNIPHMSNLDYFLNQPHLLDQLIEIIIFELLEANKILLLTYVSLD